MRPSIAAALSNLGEDHPASLVLLRPEDSARFAIAPDGSPRSERVSVRPDGSLLLFVVTGAPLYPSSITIVGAVEPAAWTWADPKKRQPAPLALGVREILGSLTPAEEAAIPDGAQALPPVGLSMVFTRSGGRWISPEGHIQQTWSPWRILRFPTRTPKNGDALGSLTVGDLDGLPVGARFVREPYMPIVKTEHNGWVTPDGTHRSAVEVLSTKLTGALDRTLVLPVKRTPKDGDRLDSFTAAELDALPVGARFDDNNSSLSPLVKGPHGWSRAGTAGFCTSADMRSLGLESRTLVLPKPVEAPKPAASPKVGDRLRDLTPEQRANLPIGTVLAPDEPGKPTMTKGVDGKWRDAIYATPFETQWLNDRPILSLPTPPPAAPKVGDRWGNLTPEQHAALPVGTVIKEEGCITVAVWTRLPSGWSRVVVRTQNAGLGWVDAQEPTDPSVIASLPVSK